MTEVGSGSIFNTTLADNWEVIVATMAVMMVAQSLAIAHLWVPRENASAKPAASSSAQTVSPTKGKTEVIYPCVCGTLPVSVGGLEVKASHDVGCAGGGTRHLVDQAFLTFVAGDALEMKPLKHSGPEACGDVIAHFWTKAGRSCEQRVLGQVPKLSIRAFYREGQSPVYSGSVVVVLDDVLVVDSLPVPLHVAVESLQRSAGSNGGIGQLGQPFEHEFFGGAHFPERYQKHSFW